MTNEINEKAQHLADAIARSAVLAELRSTENAMAADESAQELIAELQKAQERFMKLQENGDEPSEADKNVVDEIETKVEANPSIAAYMSAQDNFTRMLDSVNAILAGAIASTDGCSCGDDGCDSGCDTGGCGSAGCGCGAR